MNDKTEHLLPSYKCKAYQRQEPIWIFCDDVYTGVDAWTKWVEEAVYPGDRAQSYLPREAGEEYEVWVERFRRSPWFDVYGQAIRDFCGLLIAGAPLRLSSNSLIKGFPIKLINSSPEIEQHWENLDLMGTKAAHFLFNLAVAAMKQGHTFVLVDMPSADDSIVTQEDYLTAQRRPYWVHVEAPDVLNWRTERDGNGRVALSQVTIRETRQVPDGKFGEEEITLYRVLRPGSWELYAIQVEREGEEDKKVAVLIDYGTTSLNYIPLVPIYTNRTGFFESQPPLRSLASLNVAHYQVWSDHLQKIHHCCLPTGVREGAIVPGQEPNDEPLILGPHTFIDVPAGGDFRWAETSASSIAESRQEVHSLEQRMKMSSLAYLQEGGDRATVEEWRMRAIDVEVSLKSFAVGLKQGLDQCLQIHADYMGIKSQKAGEIEVGTDLIPGRVIDSQALMAYTSLADRGFITPAQLAVVLKEEGLLPPDMNPSEFPNSAVRREALYEILAKANPNLLVQVLQKDGAI